MYVCVCVCVCVLCVVRNSGIGKKSEIGNRKSERNPEIDIGNPEIGKSAEIRFSICPESSNICGRALLMERSFFAHAVALYRST